MYDRAPIVVSPNVCALPERGGRMFVGSNNNNNNNRNNQGGGGLGYFHPHAKFQVNAAVRDSVVVEKTKTTTVSSSPTIFSASVTVGNINECGSVEVFTSMTTKKRTGPPPPSMYDYDYDYEYDQYSSSSHHDHHQQQHTTSLLFASERSSSSSSSSSDSSDLGVFYTPPPCIPTPPSSSSIPHLSLSESSPYGWNVYDTLTATTTTTSTYTNTEKKLQDKKKKLVDVGGIRRKSSSRGGKNRGEDDSSAQKNGAGVEGFGGGGGGECRTKWTMLRRPDTPDSGYISPEVELEGCLGGF